MDLFGFAQKYWINLILSKILLPSSNKNIVLNKRALFLKIFNPIY